MSSFYSAKTEGPRPGDLPFKIDIVSPDETSDDGYGEPGTATILSNVWANVEDLTGLELVRAQMIADKSTHRITVRYHAEIESKMRAVFEGHTYHIQSVLDTGKPTRKVWLTLLCWRLESRNGA